jgi:penicillin G amidase
MRPDRMHVSRRFVLGALLVAACVLAGTWLASLVRAGAIARAAYPLAQGHLSLRGLEGRVLVDRDARGVPHIRADNEHDAFFALGFVHAQDRLGQMLWLERLARGRTAEVLGPKGLDWDRRARLIGFGRLADAQITHLAPATQRVLEAYAAGVNARIERVERGDVGAPLVVRSLGIPLETWEPADSLAVFKAYAWGLGASVETSLVLYDVIQKLGAGAAEPLFPRHIDAVPDAPQTTADAGRAAAALPEWARDPLRDALGLTGPSVGSSAWIIGGAHTLSGRPILIADSHLAPTAPPHLHLDHLAAGDLDVSGLTLPGVPVFWSGRNPQMAWASVHAPAVVTDLYVETLHPGDVSQHHDGQGWRNLTERVETLKVRNGAPETLRVVETRHGPLLSMSEHSDAISVSWTGARVDGPSGIGSLLGVARAENEAALLAALRHHHEPVLAVAYVGAHGEAGMHVAGWIPRRSLAPGLLPLPGRARWYDWKEPVPFDALPQRRLSSGEDWLVVADAPLPEPAASEPIDWLWQSGERAARIEQLLAASVANGPVDLRGMTVLQSDVGSVRAPALIGAVLALVDAEPEEHLSPEASELLGILRDWDGVSSVDSVGAAVYHEFVATLTEALLEPKLGNELFARYLALPRADTERVVFELLQGASEDPSPLHWQDRTSLARVVRESLHQAWLRVSFHLGPNRERWAWGRLHRLRFEPFGGLADAFEAGRAIAPVPYPGGRDTIAAAGFDASAPFAVRIASTARLAVDAAALDQLLVALAPGQSEHPGHPNYADGIEGWLAGRASLLPAAPLLIEEESVARLVLEPLR